MPWKLAHRPRGESTSQEVESQASTSAEAIEQLRSEIPDHHVILYVGKIYKDDLMPPS